MENQRKYRAVLENAPGDFYVEYGCCTLCGVPQAEAPDLFGGFDANWKVTHEQCFVKKQPQTKQELEQMMNAMTAQEMGCIRYSGRDKQIQAQIVAVGEENQIDWKQSKYHHQHQSSRPPVPPSPKLTHRHSASVGFDTFYAIE